MSVRSDPPNGHLWNRVAESRAQRGSAGILALFVEDGSSVGCLAATDIGVLPDLLVLPTVASNSC